MALTLYKWRQKNPGTGKWSTLAWRMTDEDAAERAQRDGVELERIEGSAEIRRPVDGEGWGGKVPPAPGMNR